MALGSGDNLSAIEASYDDSASFMEDNSTAKARTLITAGTILLRRYTEQSTHGPVTMRRSLDLIRDVIAEAKKFLQDRDENLQGPRVSHVDFTDFRRGQSIQPETCR